jgi:hemoglobin
VSADTTPPTSDFARIGEERLRALVDDFIDVVAADFIIGFMFLGKDLERIKRLEFELASSHLGGPHRYSGRTMRAAHARSPINSGHFRRRLALLRSACERHGVEPDIIERWIANNAALESQVTNGTDCVDA